jgi:hypothetical protein
MATPRKRSSGFTKPAEEVTEEVKVEELLDEVATEMFETISQKEEEVKEEPAPQPKVSTPVIIESITPVEDAGPRFVEVEPEKEPEQAVKATSAAPARTPRNVHPPKRHPRNVPKFTPFKSR